MYVAAEHGAVDGIIWLPDEPGTLRAYAMTSETQFKKAFPYQKDVLALPVTDLDAASRWYSAHFGMIEVERQEHPVPTVILERDGTRIGFAINGGDASQDGAAVLVSNIHAIKRNSSGRERPSATGASTNGMARSIAGSSSWRRTASVIPLFLTRDEQFEYSTVVFVGRATVSGWWRRSGFQEVA
jgi:catechol 2,3-dioxygenase-like lactoylglutathione lyase family enzyme